MERWSEKSFAKTDGDDASNEAVVCSVCLEELVEGDSVLDLPCRHLFHRRCLATWLRTKTTCPLDRTRLREDRDPPPISEGWVRLRRRAVENEGTSDSTEPAQGDVELVESQTGLDRTSAIQLLRENAGDVVNAIFDFVLQIQ